MTSSFASGRAFKLLINGELVDGAGHVDVINPASEAVIAHCPKADEAQLNAAIAAAKAAFPAWAATSWEARAAKIMALADVLEAQADAFARLLTEEQGKPLAEAQYEVGGSIYTLRAIAQMTLPSEVLRDNELGRIEEWRFPLGVVAAITPWNFPLILLITKLAPTLLTGNTLVAKPAPTTPLTALLIGELCAGIFPPGVINIICDANDLGGALTSHPDVAKVTFTGSTATGRKVLSNAASTIKRVTLELGGNDAALVLDDVDPIEVAAKIFAGAMANAGQVCIAVKRVYVPTGLYDAFCDELARLAAMVKLGDGFAPDTTMGPVQNGAQYEKLKALLASASAQGRVIAGGSAIAGAGYFIEPTIVRDIGDQTRLVAEEQFGPILPVLAYSDVDDAIARINASELGLAGSVWGKDLARAAAVAGRIESGTVWINHVLALDPAIPFRGAKQSGLGGEYGTDGLKEFTQARIISSVPG